MRGCGSFPSRRLAPLVLALLVGACGRSGGPPPPPAGVEIGPAEPVPWTSPQVESGVVYRMVERAPQLRAVLPHHNLPRDDAGAAIPLDAIDDGIELSELAFYRDGGGGADEPVRWSAPFPPAGFPRFTGRWIGTADHGSLLQVVVAGEVLAHAGGQDATTSGTWAWHAGRLWLVLPPGGDPAAGTVRLRQESLGHEAWHADLHGDEYRGFLIRDVTLPAHEIDRSAPQATLFEPMNRREAVYVPAPGQVEDRVTIPTGARLDVACGLVLQPTFTVGDGVRFSGLFIDDDGRVEDLFVLDLDPHRLEDRGWHDLSVELTGLAGRKGTLQLRTQPLGDARLALAAFAHPRMVVSSQDTGSPPNVLLVVIDTLRADALAGDDPVAPRLRAFAGDSLTFADAVSPSPWTTPAVISVVSGLHPRSHRGHAKQIMRNGAPSLAVDLRVQGYNTWALQTNPALRDAGIDRGFEELMFLHDAPADQVTDRAIEWLARPSGAPFFAYVHYMDPHGPYRPHPELTGWDGAAPPGVTPPEALGRLKILDWDTSFAGHDWIRRCYEEEVRFVDHHLGRLLDAGGRDGWGPHTVVVIVTDHGEELWDHGGFEHGHTFHRELLDVVLVVRPAGGTDGLAGDAGAAAVTARPASLVDVRPTVLGLLDVPVPWPCQGLDLLGDDFPEHRTRYSDANLYGPAGHAVVQGSWRLQQLGEDPARLYDLSRDPGEHQDLAGIELARRNEMQRDFEVEYSLECDTIRGAVDARSTDVTDPYQLDLVTRRALELLGYVEP